MKQSHSKHNVTSKVDHDKAFIDTNYRGQYEGPKESPLLQMDIRKRLATKELSQKFSGKTAVTTVATGLGKDTRTEIGADDTSLFEDDNASLVSNHSLGLEAVKKSPELLKIEDFMDELGKVGHISEGSDDDSFNSEDEFGEFAENDRNKFTSTLDAHRRFMFKAHKKNALVNQKATNNTKLMSHKKKLADGATTAGLGATSTSMKASLTGSANLSAKNTASAAAASSSNSLLGLITPTKSFMFLSKLSNGLNSHHGNNNNTSSVSSPSHSPQATSHKVPDSGIPGAPLSSPSYKASPSGYAYSSKHNLLHDIPSMTGSPEGKLALFGKAPQQKQLAHRAFSATTLSTLHSKFDTTHSVLSATKGSAGQQVKASTTGPAMYGDDTGNFELYHVPILNSVHGKKTILTQLDKMFHAMTVQPAPVLEKPGPPPAAAPMTLQSLLGDQLLKANIPANQRVSDQALNTLINATPGPANYGPRKTVEDPHSAASIVAQLDRALQQQRKADNEQKVRYEKIAAAHNSISPRTQQQEQQRDNHSHNAESNESYSMATFVSRLQQLDTNPTNAAQNLTPAAQNNLLSPPKLDFTKLTPVKTTNKPVSANSDPYSIDVHALKLPDINSPQTQAYYQSQKQPILCIYSPAPVEGKTPVMSPYVSPERGSPSPTSSPAHAHGHTQSGSPLQLHGTLTSSTPHHMASSPAIMYIQSPGLVQERKGLTTKASAQSLPSTHSLHNQSLASLPIVSSTHGASSHNLNNHLNHHYQTQAEYQHALHPQTQSFLQNMLHTNNPDFHDDPRNYRNGDGDSIKPSNSLEVEESIYDYEQEFIDLNAEPVGDSGRVELSTEHNRYLLPTNTVEQGGHALLDLGYQYQHSTGTYIHKDERNRSKFGQYERAPLPDPYAADFSDRHIEEIIDTTVGHGPAVIYIPPGAPAAEPTVNKKQSAFQQLTNRFAGNKQPQSSPSVSAASSVMAPMGNVNSKPKQALEAGEVVKDQNYGGVRTVMQYPRDTPLSAIHYRGGKGGAGVNLEVYSDDEAEKEEDRNAFGRDTHHHQSFISADNSTLHSHNASGSNIKQEINDYIVKLNTHGNSGYNNFNSAGYGEQSVYSATDRDYNDGSTVQSHDVVAERARVKLWDKLNNRYAGDREGEFVRKKAIKEYVYDGVKQDTRIMHEYMEEMEEGWKI